MVASSVRWNINLPIQPKAATKYLGMMFFMNRPFTKARKMLMAKARVRMWALQNLMATRHVAATPAVQRVFVACVRTIFLYAVEVWGTGMTVNQWKDVQQLQTDFYRVHLGLKSSICTAMVLAEVGDYPLEQATPIRTARFYSRIT